MSASTHTNTRVVYKPKQQNLKKTGHSFTNSNSLTVYLPKPSTGGHKCFTDPNQKRLNPWNYPEIGRKDEEIPLPQGESAYAKAKRAEYIERNLPKAEKYYRLAIKNKERLESSIKDLATVLHQQGKTEEAIALLENNRHICIKHADRLENLLMNLKKQAQPSGNFYNRTLVLFNCPFDFDEAKVKSLFKNTTRIIQVEFQSDEAVSNLLNSFEIDEQTLQDKPTLIIPRACLINFSSNSGARKTLETLIDQETYTFYWMNTEGKIKGKAIPFKKKTFEKKESSEDNRSESVSVDTQDVSSKDSKTELSNSHRGLELSHDSGSEEGEVLSDPWRSMLFPMLPPEVREDSCVKLVTPHSFFDEYILEEKFSDYEYKLPELDSWRQIEQTYAEMKTIIENHPNFIGEMIQGIRRIIY